MAHFAVPKLGMRLHHGQIEVFRNPSRFRTIVAGRRWGKTHLAKAEIIRGARGKGRRLIWYVAPTFSMAREIMWDELIEAIPAAWVKKKHETRLEIRLINGTVIQLKGADRPDTLRGRGVDLVILDEFQDFRPEVWTKVIYPTLAQTLGRALIIGTPKSYNHFYDLYRLGMIEKNRRSFTWSSWQFPTIMSPFFPPSEIKMARENLDPKTFRQEFEACHIGSTEVLLADGRHVRVDKLFGGEKLIHVNDNGHREECVISRCGFTGNKEIIELQLETGDTLSASKLHRYKYQKVA